MKLTISIFYFIFSLFFSAAEVPDEIVAALKIGKSSELVKYFAEKVSVKISNQEDVLSKPQAEANIKYFFEKHAVKAFSSSHISSMNNSAQYITGTLETANGKFRVSILIRNNLISQFRIEDDNE
ncbi:MAG: hypothetical protein JWO32_2604 [Bacteroidetes bacterium]|jgi:hypothetical protein|nr:hypothetical protein [Bacteroidota bacterium]